ncbi:MAG: iron ABC transporter permease [Candidatus Carbobacillus altaicus]|nr:iron ABC transporter permease [Candidatus Carbobacillus altaicus]
MSSTSRKIRILSVETASLTVLLALLFLTGAPLLALLQLIFFGNLDAEKMNLAATLKSLFNSIILGGTVILLASLLALPLAFLRAKTIFKRYNWLDWLILIPYMTPPYLGSMGWILWLRSGGYLQQLFPIIHDPERLFYNFFMLALIMSLHIYPFLYWSLKEAFFSIGASIEEAATVYGRGTTGERVRLWSPLFVTAWAASALIVFVETVGEFGAPATFGRVIGFPVLTTEIYRKVASWPINLPYAALLSFLMLAVVLIVWLSEWKIRQKFSFHLLGGKGHRTQTITLSTVQTILAWMFVILLLALSVGIPYSAMLIRSFTRLVGRGLTLDNISLVNYFEIFYLKGTAWKAFQTSFTLAFGAAFFAVLIGSLVALIIHKRRALFKPLIEGLALTPMMIPAIVWTIGLMIFWNSPSLPFTLYNTPSMMILTYTLLYFPFALQYVKTSYRRIDPKLFEAALVFQPNALNRFIRITLPLLFESMLAAFLMTFIISFRELVAALLILPPGMQTVSTYIYSQFEQGSTGTGMAAAVVSTLITLFIMILLKKIQKENL